VRGNRHGHGENRRKVVFDSYRRLDTKFYATGSHAVENVFACCVIEERKAERNEKAGSIQKSQNEIRCQQQTTHHITS